MGVRERRRGKRKESTSMRERARESDLPPQTLTIELSSVFMELMPMLPVTQNPTIQSHIDASVVEKRAITWSDRP